MPDRTVLVTGGAGGLGRSVVATLLAAGWRVVVPVETGAATSRIATGLSTVVADLTDPDDVARAVARGGRAGRSADARWSTWSAGSRPTSRWPTRRSTSSSGCSR